MKKTWIAMSLLATGCASTQQAAKPEAQVVRAAPPAPPPPFYPDSLATLQSICAVTEDMSVEQAAALLRAGPLPGLTLTKSDEPRLVQRWSYTTTVPGIEAVQLTSIQGQVTGVEIHSKRPAEATRSHVERLLGKPLRRVTLLFWAEVDGGSLVSTTGGGDNSEIICTRQQPSIDKFLNSTR